MDVIDRILALLKEKNIAEVEFYKAIGVDKSTYSRWKSREYKVSLCSLKKIADYFDMTVDSLINTD